MKDYAQTVSIFFSGQKQQIITLSTVQRQNNV